MDKVNQYNNGEVVMLENLRFNPEETGSSVDEAGNKVKASKESI